MLPAPLILKKVQSTFFFIRGGPEVSFRKADKLRLRKPRIYNFFWKRVAARPAGNGESKEGQDNLNKKVLLLK